MYLKQIKPNNFEFVNNQFNYTTAFINAIRRTLIANIPSYIFNNFEIISNSSDFNDDIIKSNISLIPINCDQNDLEGILDIKNAEKTDLIITSDLIKTNVVVFPEIPILTLKPNQEINIKMKTELGTAEKNAKWQVCNSSYDLSQGILYIESDVPWLLPNDLLKKAIQILIEKLEFQLLLLKQYKIKIENNDKNPKQYIYTFENENHTFGNIVASILQHMSDVVYMAGYQLNHPLDNFITIKLELDPNCQDKNENIMIKAIEDSILIFQNLYE